MCHFTSSQLEKHISFAMSAMETDRTDSTKEWADIKSSTIRLMKEYKEVPVCNDAVYRLITQKQPVRFYGEGNFSFSTALAAARGSFANIEATTMESSAPDAV